VRGTMSATALERKALGPEPGKVFVSSAVDPRAPGIRAGRALPRLAVPRARRR
jgi:hypothetical protein